MQIKICIGYHRTLEKLKCGYDVRIPIKMKGNLFIITSPSGGGKGTLIKRVLPNIEDLSYSVSFTTREKT